MGGCGGTSPTLLFGTKLHRNEHLGNCCVKKVTSGANFGVMESWEFYVVLVAYICTITLWQVNQSVSQSINQSINQFHLLRATPIIVRPTFDCDKNSCHRGHNSFSSGMFHRCLFRLNSGRCLRTRSPLSTSGAHNNFILVFWSCCLRHRCDWPLWHHAGGRRGDRWMIRSNDSSGR